MDKNGTKTPETHSGELVDSLKTICDIVIGPELRLIEEYVGTITESLSLDHTNLTRKVESSIATILEDAMAVSADLRNTKLEVESGREELNQKIAGLENQIQKSGGDLSEKISATESTLATDIAELQEDMKAQDHARRFEALEERLALCEEVNSALKEENVRLINRLASAAHSLVTGANEIVPAPKSSADQVDSLLNEIDEERVEPVLKDSGSDADQRGSNDSTLNPAEIGNDDSSEGKMVDLDAVLYEI